MQAHLAHALDDLGPVNTKRGGFRVDIRAQMPLEFFDHRPRQGYGPQTRSKLALRRGITATAP